MFRVLSLGAAVALVVVVALLVMRLDADPDVAAQGTNAGPAQPAAAEALQRVTVIEVGTGAADEPLPLTATVTTERSAALSPRVSGLVSAVHVDAGDRVAAGKVLLELDRALARLALERAGAALEEAQAALAEAERLHAETAELVERRLVPKTRLPAAEAAMRVAGAAVERLRSEQRQQGELLRRHTVVAPFAGVVSRRLTELGEWVETGTPVLELVDTGRLRVDVQVPQERHRAVAAGTAVKVRFDAQPGQVFDATVVTTVPVKDPNARTFLARIPLQDVPDYVTPGMSARVSFVAGADAAVLRVPRDVLVRQPDGSNVVWVVEADGDTGAVSPRRVQIGASLSDRVEIHAGLEPGAVVVLRGNETLKDGQRVRLMASAAAQAGS